jgi:hypothetical protein
MRLSSAKITESLLTKTARPWPFPQKSPAATGGQPNKIFRDNKLPQDHFPLECNYFNRLPENNRKISHVSERLTRTSAATSGATIVYVEGEFAAAFVRGGSSVT